MKGLAAVALAMAIALPACAQRGGGGHASFGGRSAPAARPAPAFHGGFAPSPAFHGGFSPSHGTFAASPPVHYSYGRSPLSRPPVSYPSSMRVPAPGVRYPVTTPPINRPNFYHPDHGHGHRNTHNFFVHTYPVFPFAYPSYVYGYLPSDLLDDSFNNYDTSQQPPPDQQPDYGSAYAQPMPQPDDGSGYPQPAPGYPAYPEPRPAPQGAYAYPGAAPGYQGYAPQPAPAAPQMQYVPGSASTVTLIYKDGRPPEQIQNFLATRSTLTVLDGGRRREIPLTDLDLPATIAANRQTGVDFQLPSAAR